MNRVKNARKSGNTSLPGSNPKTNEEYLKSFFLPLCTPQKAPVHKNRRESQNKTDGVNRSVSTRIFEDLFFSFNFRICAKPNQNAQFFF